MHRARIYETQGARNLAPCPNCRLANGAHTSAQAVTCWRAEIRHPDADADDMILLTAGAVAGIVGAPPAAIAATAAQILDELNAALEDRLANTEVEAELVEGPEE